MTILAHPQGGMFDIDEVSDAELGAVFRASIKARMAEKIRATTPAVLAQRAKQEAEQATAITEEQAERKGKVLPGFTVGTHLVPDLDLSVVTNLQEVVSAKTRSPYNKALYAQGQDLLDPESATYAVLADLHPRLKKAAKKARKAKPGPVKKVTAVVAVTDTDNIAQIAQILGISEKKARKMVTA